MNDRVSIKDMRIGVYDVNVIDANGNTIQDTIEIGVDDFSIDYDINSIVHYNEEENRTELSEFVNDITNGGFISGSFEVTEMPINELGITYNVSIECPENAPIDSIDVGSEIWNMLYKENKFYACGYGTYKVYIHELKNGVRNGHKYLHSTFTINDGNPAPNVRIGAFDYFNEDGTSDFKVANFETAKQWDDYEKYRTIVSTEKMGTSFMLSFNYINTDKIFKEIYAGKPISKTDGSLYNDVVLSTKVPNGYVLDFKQLTQEGEYYYTAYNENIFATPYKRYIVVNEVDVEHHPTGKRYANIVFNEIGYYFIVNGSDTELYHAKNKNEELKYDVINEDVDYIVVGLMISAPLYYNPFSFKVVKILNTNYYLPFNVQAYEDSIIEEVIDDATVAYSDCDDINNLSRLKVEFTKPTFGEPKLRYNYRDDKFEFKLGALNESLNNATYDLFVPSNNENSEDDNQLCFDYDGKFTVTGLTNDTYMELTSAQSMEISNDNGTMVANIIIYKDDIIENTVWAFAKRKIQYGDEKEDYRFNTIKECTFIKTLKNKLSFPKKATNLFDGVKLVNMYHLNNVDYILYEQKNDEIKEISKENTEEYAYSKMSLQCIANREFKLTVKADDDNQYHHGVVYEHKNSAISTSNFPSEIQYNTYSTYFAIEEKNNGRYSGYQIKFDYTDAINMNVTLIDGAEDKTGFYQIVLAARDGDGNIMKHDKFNANTTLNLTFEELMKIDKFEVLYVKDYENAKNSGASANPENNNNNTLTGVTISCKCTVDNDYKICDSIKYQIDPIVTDVDITIAEIYDDNIKTVVIKCGSFEIEVDRHYENFDINKLTLYPLGTYENYKIISEITTYSYDKTSVTLMFYPKIDNNTCTQIQMLLDQQAQQSSDILFNIIYNGDIIKENVKAIHNNIINVDIPEFDSKLFSIKPTDDTRKKYKIEYSMYGL